MLRFVGAELWTLVSFRWELSGGKHFLNSVLDSSFISKSCPWDLLLISEGNVHVTKVELTCIYLLCVFRANPQIAACALCPVNFYLRFKLPFKYGGILPVYLKKSPSFVSDYLLCESLSSQWIVRKCAPQKKKTSVLKKTIWKYFF